MTKRARSPGKRKSKGSRSGAAKTARAKSGSKQKLARKAPAADALDDFVAAAARALDLPLDPAWKGAVKTNLQVTLALAASFADFPLPDDAEPAPVFTA
jgi:hypothetical protein